MKRCALALLAILGASCSDAPPPAPSPFDDPQVLAIVGEEKITRADFDGAAADRAIAPDALLDELIEHRALVQTARERGYDRDPAHLAAVERMLANRVREEHRESQQSAISDAEIEARYRAEQKKFAVPARIRAAMIFVEAPSTFSEAKRAERRAAIEAARTKAFTDPSQFRALAAEYSYDQATKFRGGDVGWLVEGIGAEELGDEVLTAAFALVEPGAISEIITTPRGHYLLQLTERTAAGVRPLASVAGQVRAELQREKQQRTERELKSATLANRRIEARRDRLPAARPLPSATPPAVPAER